MDILTNLSWEPWLALGLALLAAEALGASGFLIGAAVVDALTVEAAILADRQGRLVLAAASTVAGPDLDVAADRAALAAVGRRGVAVDRGGRHALAVRAGRGRRAGVAVVADVGVRLEDASAVVAAVVGAGVAVVAVARAAGDAHAAAADVAVGAGVAVVAGLDVKGVDADAAGAEVVGADVVVAAVLGRAGTDAG